MGHFEACEAVNDDKYHLNNCQFTRSLEKIENVDLFYEAQGLEPFVDAMQQARMPVLLVKPCSTGTHLRCLIRKGLTR